MIKGTGTEIIAPIYSELAGRLRRSIEEGEFLPGQLIGSEHELARQENISRMTVRRASEMLVNEGLLERRPGKGLYVRKAQANTQLIQVIAANLRWEPCLQVSQGVQAAAKHIGMEVQLYDAHGDADLDVEVVRRLPSGSARGAVIVSLHSPAFNEAVYELKARDFPFVLVDQRLFDINVPSVTADNQAGGYQVGQSLTKIGHRRIAFMGDLIANTVRDRLGGLRDAMGDAGLPFDRSLSMDLIRGDDRLGDWSARIEECTRELMNRADRPTAIFCSCDAVARGLYRALAAMNLSVPRDVSVVGFDDDPLGEWLSPALTTVRQPFADMGKLAMEMLSRRIDQPAGWKVEQHVLPVKLVERASVAAPRIEHVK